jgi:hypothetical protein
MLRVAPFQVSNELEFDGKSGYLEFNASSIIILKSAKKVSASLFEL